MIEAPHIGNILKEFVKRNRIFQSAWARDAGVTPQTTAKYLKQPSLQVDTLFAVCQQLNYNFFEQIAAQLTTCHQATPPYPMPILKLCKKKMKP